MKKRLLSIFLVIALGTSLVACGQKETKKDEQASKPATTEATKTTEDKETASTSEDKQTLSISWFEGGYGKDYVEEAMRIMEEKYPNLEIKADIHPKNHEQLRPQFVAGNPPDVFLANASFFDYFALMNSNMLMPLDDIMSSEALNGQSGTFGDMFLPGVLQLGKKGDSFYLAPALNKFHGIWYSGKTFADNNFEVPVTQEDFNALAGDIKDLGITPFTFQGLYPHYLTRAYLMPAISAKGGTKAVKDLCNLEPDAWLSQPVLDTIKEFKDYADNYLLDGTLALNHTQAQMEFLTQRVGLIPCGTWLEKEMKGNWPDNFELKFIAPPVKVNASDTSYVTMNTNFIAIPAAAKNPQMGKEFLKLMYSETMREYIASTTGATMPIKDATKGFEDQLPASVLQANTLVQEENAEIIMLAYEIWYKPLHKKLNNTLTALIMGEYTPEQFCEEMEKEAERIRADENIHKYTLD